MIKCDHITALPIQKGLILIITTIFLATLGGCDFLSGVFFRIFPGEEKAVQETYMEYLNAKNNGDIESLKKLIVKEKARGLEGEQAAQMLKIVQAFSPSAVTITGTQVTGDRAALTLQAEAEGGIMKGEVSLLKEEGKWKINEEKWDMKIYPKPIRLEGGEDAPQFEPIEAVFLSPGPFYGMQTMEPFLKDQTAPILSPTIVTGHEGEVTGLAFSPDGRFLFSSSYGDYTIRLWDVNDGKELQAVRIENRPMGMDISPDGTVILLTDASGNVIVLPVSFDKIGAPQIIPAQVGHNSSIAVSPNNRMFATASFDKFVTIGNMTDKTRLRRIETPEPMRDVAFSPSGEILAASTATNKIILWNLRDGKGRKYTISKVDAKSDVGRIHFSPNGKYLATAHMDSSITVWDVEKQKEVHNFYVPNSSTWTIRFSPDGKVFATANQDTLIHLWDTETGRSIIVLKGHTASPRSIAFSPDSKALASGGEDRNIILWR
jgi:DNA-binding beta-propeller fold protein YncE